MNRAKAIGTGIVLGLVGSAYVWAVAVRAVPEIRRRKTEERALRRR